MLFHVFGFQMSDVWWSACDIVPKCVSVQLTYTHCARSQLQQKLKLQLFAFHNVSSTLTSASDVTGRTAHNNFYRKTSYKYLLILPFFHLLCRAHCVRDSQTASISLQHSFFVAFSWILLPSCFGDFVCKCSVWPLRLVENIFLYFCLFDPTEINWMEEICFSMRCCWVVGVSACPPTIILCMKIQCFIMIVILCICMCRWLGMYNHAIDADIMCGDESGFFLLLLLWFQLNVFSLALRWHSREIDIKPLINYFSWILAFVVFFFSLQKF